MFTCMVFKTALECIMFGILLLVVVLCCSRDLLTRWFSLLVNASLDPQQCVSRERMGDGRTHKALIKNVDSGSYCDYIFKTLHCKVEKNNQSSATYSVV